jgi:hypothetical protein
LLLYFSLTLFVSATLLFLVQPMIGKMMLPRLGGTPAVWNTCMVFFQMALLAGYAYTHTVSSMRNRRHQLLMQGVLLLLPFAVLPFTLGAWEPPSEGNPVFAVLFLLAGLVGLPFLVVATSAPLLQKWFGHTGHPAAKDPYFLYGASNLGSMLALVLYPVLIEPMFSVEEQAVLWTFGYGVLVLLVLGCAYLVWNVPEPVTAAAPAEPLKTPEPIPAAATAFTTQRRKTVRLGATESPIDEADEPARDIDRITVWRRLRWVMLAAIPSSLMLGVTTHMTTDIAGIPFFWVIPLALYLFTFILVFARWPVVWTGTPHTVVLYLQPCLLLFLILKLTSHISMSIWTEFALHIASFFATTLMCHGELAKDRPSSKHLTEFYLLMSVGGMLGGMFNALFAPVFITWGIYEYPIAMALACLLRPNLVDEPIIPGDSAPKHPTPLGYGLDLLGPLAVAGAILGLVYYVEKHDIALLGYMMSRKFVLAFGVVAVLGLSMRPMRFGLGVGLLLLFMIVYDRSFDPVIFEDRGFFGLLRVREGQEKHKITVAGDENEEDQVRYETKTYRTLIHGGINHGRQIHEPKQYRRTPITYFHPKNGVGELFGKFSWPDQRLPASLFGLAAGPQAPWGLLACSQSEPAYAVIGLGTGTLALHAKPFQRADFFEIDPLVRRLSLPPKGEEPIFTYVQDALDRKADLRVIMGDGRLKIKESPDQLYHILLLDAFSSDAIPVHLLTAQAIELYMTKLVDGGALLFNVTNRYVSIAPVLSRIAQELDLECYRCEDYASQDPHPDKYSADWVVLQRRPPTGGFTNGAPPLTQRLNMNRWKEVPPLEGPMWTDSYSNLLRVMDWGF